MTNEVTKGEIRAILENMSLLANEVNAMGKILASVQTALEAVPRLNEEQHDHLETKQCNTEKRVDKIEINQRWVAITLIGLFIAQVWESILK